MRAPSLGRLPGRTSKPAAPRQARPAIRRQWVAVSLAVAAIAASGADLAAHAARPTLLEKVTVAATSLPAGTVVTAADLAEVDLLVPRGFSQPPPAPLGQLVGRVLLVPVTRGQQVFADEAAAPKSGRAMRQISFGLPLSHALAGALEVGDRVDVLATSGTGSGAVTTVLGRALAVTAVTAPQSGLSAASDPTIAVTLACPDSETALQIANGAASQTIWLDLANGAARPDDPGTYQLSFSG